MTWVLQRALDLIELIVNWFYSRKYGTMVRRFGRGTAEDDDRRGLIILQIDGLSHDSVQTAVEHGTMSYLKRLLSRDGYRLQKWWCGVPSSTPAIQGGLLYGTNWNIPSFRWYEKSSGKTLVAKNPRDARILQERLASGRIGLLEGGSSYVNLFDGGARLSLFTVSALGGQKFFENVRGVSFAMLLVLSPLRLLRIVGTVLWDYGRDLWNRLAMRFETARGRRRRPFSPLSSLLQIFATVVFRELQTFGVILDIYRRVPVIYCNFYGYDDVAHQLGPHNTETDRVLKGIDRRIREIDTTRRRFAARRAYDLYVMSDHGMSPATPFQERFGHTLGELMGSLVQSRHLQPVLDESGTSQWRADAETRFLLEELEGIRANLSPRSQKLASALGRFVARRVPPEEEQEWDLRRHSDIILRNSGTISLVYFNVTAQQMDLSEVELVYPGLLRRLVEHPGLGLVLGREQGEAMAMTLRGPRRLFPPVDPLVMDLLDNLDDEALAAQQLARLAKFPASGDLILLGRWNSQGYVIGFEPHWATHGGLGGNQNHPFMLLPPSVDWDIAAVTSPEQLYPLFMSRYGRSSQIPGNRRQAEVPLGRGSSPDGIPSPLQQQFDKSLHKR